MIEVLVSNNHNEDIHDLKVRQVGRNFIELNNGDTFTLNKEKLLVRVIRIKDYPPITEMIREPLESIEARWRASKEFSIGDGVNYSVGSDIYSGTVVHIEYYKLNPSKAKVIHVQYDNVMPLPVNFDFSTLPGIPEQYTCHAEGITWLMLPHPNTSIDHFTHRRKKDRYVIESNKDDRYYYLRKGRHTYRDPHF